MRSAVGNLSCSRRDELTFIFYLRLPDFFQLVLIQWTAPCMRIGLCIYHHVTALFSFLYFLKIKISKIYVRFEIFQKYPRSPPIGRQVLSVIFFLQIRNEVPGKKKGPVAPQRATGACRPPLGRQGPVAPLGGDMPFFFQGLFFPGTYFELFERVFVIIVGKISAANSYRT